MTTGAPSAEVVVFVGPSFPALRVTEFLTGAVVRRPIRRGDLDGLASPTVVAILDGVFDAVLAISPREIRNAIARGVRVYGGASMGALRASEVPAVVGVGRVYEMYRDGVIDRDDEVALLMDAESGEALTVPLVNVRFAVASLVKADSLEEAAGAAIVGAASKLHFSERTYRRILREAGIGAGPSSDALRAGLEAIDLKREDAQSLLERLAQGVVDAPPAFPAQGVIERGEDEDDPFDAVRVEAEATPDTPVQIWECGEKLPFRALVRFMAVTGSLWPHLRSVLRASDVDPAGGAAVTVPAREGAPVPSVQELFADLMDEWGWNTPEEVHVTLRDLGVGFTELQNGLRIERSLRARCARLHEARSEESAVLQALRVHLLSHDLTLKREAMRLGALEALAAAGTDASPPSAAELREATRAAICARPEMTWPGMLAEGGISAAEAGPTLDLIARARRVGGPLLARMRAAPRLPGSAGAGAASFPPVRKGAGSGGRSVSDSAAAEIARALGRAIGVTRVAQLGQLERFGLHVAAAFRPSDWSSSFGSGKAETPQAAAVGAVMEELEKYCQERFVPETAECAPFDALVSRGARAVDPRTLALPFDSAYRAEQELPWTTMRDLVSGDTVLVPRARLNSERERNDPFFSARRARKIFNTNGLASSLSLTEAVLHALCELVERHANKLSEQRVGNPGLGGGRHPPHTFVDLETCPSSTRALVAKIREAGFEARALDITCEITVPTFAVRIVQPDGLHGFEGAYCPGSCAHPDPELALNRALLEAVQTRIASTAGAREDFGFKPRSLGRHERPRPKSAGDAHWFRPHVPKKPFADVEGTREEDARDDLHFVLRRLTAAGFERVLWRDLSREETLPASVVRAVVPRLEDTNPFFTGLRARAVAVEELLQEHAW